MAKTRWGGAQENNQQQSSRKRRPVGGMYVNPTEQAEGLKESFGSANLRIVMSPGTKLVLADENGNETAYDNDSASLRIFVNDRPKNEKSFHFNLVAYVDEE